jgi:hypothetical protein
MGTHRPIALATVVLFTMGAMLAAGAQAASGTAKLRGQILASDQPVPTLDDEDKVADTLKKWQKGTIEKAKDSESWTLHLVSFPDKKPGVSQLSFVFYDVSDGKAKYLTTKDVTCDANAEILASEVEVDTEDGIKPGMKVDVTLARIVGNKQTDLAKTKITLK